ncbi:MAG: DUF4266 domain-containing protein [Burkholderiaceae bacterium]|nr:DUF4266 domain-containing protein [Burkholderiaceae bacterium]
MRAALIAALAVAGVSGCSVEAVKPWQKGTLARSEMNIEGAKPETRFDEHIYTSREAAAGGASVGGGGCGCN